VDVDVAFEQPQYLLESQHEPQEEETQVHTDAEDGAPQLDDSPRSSDFWEEEWENQENQRFGERELLPPFPQQWLLRVGVVKPRDLEIHWVSLSVEERACLQKAEERLFM
jgi:hypothetical protein